MKDLVLNWWESFIVGAAVTFLTSLLPKITNPLELAGLKAAIQFLQSLLSLANKKASKLFVIVPRAKQAMTDTQFNEWFANLEVSFQNIYSLTLLHAVNYAYEGPTFPEGRIDFVLSPEFIGSLGPISMYIGLGTVEIEYAANGMNTDYYASVVYETLTNANSGQLTVVVAA